MGKNRDILFKGFYGFGNIGDDVFIIIANWWCKNYLEKYNPIFIGKKLPKNITGIEVGNRKRRIIELYYILFSKNIIFFGGSLFNNKIHLLDIRNILGLNKKLRKKTMAFGVSIGPFKSEDEKIANLLFLNSLNKVFVRDFRSFEFNKKKFNYSADPALLLGQIYPKLITQNRKSLGINIGNFPTSEENIENIINLLNKDEIYKKYSNIKCFIFNNDDAVNSQLLVQSLKESDIDIKIEIINYTEDTLEFLSELSTCRVMVGERLHSAIIAMSMNIPFILFEYHEKCTDFLKEIDYDINSDNAKELILKEPDRYISKLEEIKKHKCDKLLVDLKRMAEEVTCQN